MSNSFWDGQDRGKIKYETQFGYKLYLAEQGTQAVDYEVEDYRLNYPDLPNPELNE